MIPNSRISGLSIFHALPFNELTGLLFEIFIKRLTGELSTTWLSLSFPALLLPTFLWDGEGEEGKESGNQGKVL